MLSGFILAASLFSCALADFNGMDMDMDGPMALATGSMLPYLHFTPGDNLWFLGWVPQSTGAMVGTCIGLFLLALVERWIAASRAIMEIHWAKCAQIALSNKLNTARAGEGQSDKNKSDKNKSQSTSLASLITLRSAPPFIPAHDITRGILHIGQSILGFAFMLAVMTFQAGFILSIVIGLGVGETLFGRYINRSAHLH